MYHLAEKITCTKRTRRRVTVTERDVERLIKEHIAVTHRFSRNAEIVFHGTDWTLTETTEEPFTDA